MAKNRKNANESILGDSCDVHFLWHTLGDYLKRWYFYLSSGIKKDFSPSKRKYRGPDFGEVVGWPAMKRLKNFSRKYPGLIIVNCDDEHFCSSLLCLIPHECGDDYFGTTLLFVPQIAPERNVLFLHPHELDNLIEELQKLSVRQKTKKK